MKADIRWLDDPQVFRVNRLDAHSDHKFYENKEDYEKKEQRLKQSLNGIWKFRYSENAMERPADFYQKWFQCRSFDEMKVPQHIELAGYDKIHYINTMYPWEALAVCWSGCRSTLLAALLRESRAAASSPIHNSSPCANMF